MKKLTLPKQIACAVLAVLLTAGLGTAALASSEPPARPDAAMTQSAGGDQRPAPDMSRAPSGEPGQQAPTQPQGENAPAEGSQPAPSGEPGQNAPQEGQTPPDIAQAKPAENDGPNAPADPGQKPADGAVPASGEPGGTQAPDSKNAPGLGRAQAPGKESIDRGGLLNTIRELWNRLQSLLGIRQSGAPAQVSPSFEPGQQPNAQPGQTQAASGEMGQTSGEMGQGSGEMGQASGEPTAYAAANTLTGDSAGAAYASASGDENAVLVSGDTVTLTGATVTKTGSSAGESADFYGVNAGVLAKDSATLTIRDAEISTDGTHANGVFSYGKGTTVNISDSVITTNADNSGGIMTTGGAAMNAVNLTVSTAGNSSAAIRSDRGGGTVNVTEGSYATSGVGSPAIYSTADITVAGATLTSATSEAVVIEGGNSVTLTNSAVSGNNSRLNGQSTVKTNVLIYQSMSGDAAEGSSAFTMTGGSMTAGTGAMFHVTNVTTEISLSGVDFTYASDSDVFLDASADAWGSAGKNGGNVVLNLDDQDIVGIITADSNSSVALNLKNGSTWTLTGDSYITSLDGDTSGIDLNGYALYVNGVAWKG